MSRDNGHYRDCAYTRMPARAACTCQEIMDRLAAEAESKREVKKVEDELKPCPFCGRSGDDLDVWRDDLMPDSIAWRARCPDWCQAEGPLTDTREKAIAEWNRRLA